MAEFCLDCLNKLNGLKDPPEKYVISKELDLCEECCMLKPIIIRIRRRYLAVEWLRKYVRNLRKSFS